jgi:hypothetical protein
VSAVRRARNLPDPNSRSIADGGLGRLDAPGQAALLHDLEQFWIDNNLATNGENHPLIGNEYLMAHAANRTTRC